jgi:hypothetical protein
MDKEASVGYALPITTRSRASPALAITGPGSGNSCATLTMAEKTIFDPRASRGAEAPYRRLPFAPIFDTIVAERLPDSPVTTEEPVTKVFARPAEGNVFHGPTVVELQKRPKQAVLSRGNPITWIMVTGFLLLGAGIVLQNIQLERQDRTLSQLVEGTSKLAASLSDSRVQEQRPWVTISDPIPQSLSVAPGSFAVSLQNTGKTPAADVKVAATAQVIEVANASALPAIAPVSRAAGTLFPRSQFRTVLDFQPSPAAFTALFRGQGRMEVRVNVSYTDVQHNAHVTQSCWHWRPALRQMEPCASFGAVN